MASMEHNECFSSNSFFYDFSRADISAVWNPPVWIFMFRAASIVCADENLLCAI